MSSNDRGLMLKAAALILVLTFASTAVRAQTERPPAAPAPQSADEFFEAGTSALYQLGTIYFQQGKHTEAAEMFRRVLHTDATHVHANHALGVVYVTTGNKTGAMQQYYILRDLNPAIAADLQRMILK